MVTSISSFSSFLPALMLSASSSFITYKQQKLTLAIASKTRIGRRRRRKKGSSQEQKRNASSLHRTICPCASAVDTVKFTCHRLQTFGHIFSRFKISGKSIQLAEPNSSAYSQLSERGTSGPSGLHNGLWACFLPRLLWVENSEIIQFRWSLNWMITQVIWEFIKLEIWLEASEWQVITILPFFPNLY